MHKRTLTQVEAYESDHTANGKRHQQTKVPASKPIVSYYTSMPRTAYYTSPLSSSSSTATTAADSAAAPKAHSAHSSRGSSPLLMDHHGNQEVQEVLKSYENAPIYVRQMVSKELERMGLIRNH